MSPIALLRTTPRSRLALIGQCAALIVLFFALDWFLKDHVERGMMFQIFHNLLHTRPPMPMAKDGTMVALGVGLIDLMQALPLIAAAYLVGKLERRTVGDYGLPLRGSALTQFAHGAAWGLVGVTLVLLPMFVAGDVQLGHLVTTGAFAVKYGVLWAVACIAVGVFDEFQFRGFLLFTAARAINFWPAAIGLSALFAVAHLGNPGEDKAGVLSVFVFGLVFSFLVRVTGSLWLAIGFHASWDFTQDFLYGVPDSGLVSQGRLFAPVFHGPAWLTGGSVGPEGSVFCPVFLLLMAYAVWRMHRRAPEVVAASA